LDLGYIIYIIESCKPVLNRFSGYVLRRWAAPLLGALFFYGCLMVAQNMVGFSREIFEQGAPLRWLLPLLATAMPEILGMVLPMAAVLGGLMGTQALMEGSELTAAQGLGVGPGPWLRPFAVLGSLLATLALFNAHLFVPASLHLQQSLRERMAQEAKARILRPGGQPWIPPKGADTALWADPQGRLHVMESGPAGVRHVVADRFSYGLGAVPDGSWSLHIELDYLKGVVLNPKSDSILHLDQAHQVMDYRIPPAPRLLRSTPFRYLSTGELRAIGSGEALVEWQRRFGLPLASAALLLVGIALGFGHPRFNRGGAVLKSMGVIILYYLIERALEGALQGGRAWALGLLLALPFVFLAWGGWLFRRRLRPHHTPRVSRIMRAFRAPLAMSSQWWQSLNKQIETVEEKVHGDGATQGVLERWASWAWMRQWAAALGSLAVLVFLVEYANLASDLSDNHVGFHVFLIYFFWKLPTLLPLLLPVSFLLGSVMALSEWGLTQEWVGLRAGGVSLVRLLWALRWAWGFVLAGTAALQLLLAPMANQRARETWHRIVNRPYSAQVKPWLYLGNTGVLWHLHGDLRWGFPLKSPGEAPVLLRWSRGEAFSDALPWGSGRLLQGPAAKDLFPAEGLRRAAEAEDASTMDLLQWQRWAPDPERAYLLWSRLLGWLAGPILLLATLSFAFPKPRQGRGSALGLSLVVALVFMGLQALFGGAARAAELPATWGVLAPYLLLSSFFLLRLRALRT
jgi:lipopolysaccharide export LptBFGC system permease protein LptF